MKIPKIGKLLRRNFLAGLLVFIPIAVTVWFIRMVMDWVSHWVWQIYAYLPYAIKPTGEIKIGVNLFIVLAIIFATAFLLSLLGWVSKFYLGEQALKYLQRLIQRIPILGVIYGSLDQLLRTLATGSGKQFSRVVYLEFPRKGVWVVAFVTSPVISPQFKENYLNVFVPAVPNPTSGFHLIVPESEVRDTNMKVDEAFKLILSLGLAQKQ